MTTTTTTSPEVRRLDNEGQARLEAALTDGIVIHETMSPASADGLMDHGGRHLYRCLPRARRVLPQLLRDGWVEEVGRSEYRPLYRLTEVGHAALGIVAREEVGR